MIQIFESICVPFNKKEDLGKKEQHMELYEEKGIGTYHFKEADIMMSAKIMVKLKRTQNSSVCTKTSIHAHLMRKISVNVIMVFLHVKK